MKQDGHEAVPIVNGGASTQGSGTPRTDVEEYTAIAYTNSAMLANDKQYVVLAEFARQLEREALELLEALRELEAAALKMARLVNLSNKSDGAPVTEWDAARQAVDKARVKARALMRKVDGTETSTVAQDK